nr:hypothetical protein [Tanacetum cinerariifolium]
IPDRMINDDIKLSKEYKTYLDYATAKVPPKKARKFKKPASSKLKTVPASPKEPTQKDTSDKSVSKKKAPAKNGRGKGIKLLSDAALLDEAQMKKALKKRKTKDTSKRTGMKTRVLDVAKDDSSNSNNDSWGESEDESDDDHDEDDNDDKDDNDDDDDDDYNPSFTLKDYKEEEDNEEHVLTSEKDKSNDEDKMYEKDDDVSKELYGYLNITQGLRDTDLTNAQQGGEDQLNASYESGFVQEEEDAHVTLTTVHDKTEDPLQRSSISFDFTSKLLNLDDSSTDINSQMNTSTVHPPPLPVYPSLHPTTIHQQQTPDSITTTTNPAMTLPEIPNFASLF